MLSVVLVHAFVSTHLLNQLTFDLDILLVGHDHS